MDVNTLYFGDNLHILRKYIPDECIDLIYLDPPFNSNANYNILFKEPSGKVSESQIQVFNDTWHWTENTVETFDEIIRTSSSEITDLMISLRNVIHENDMMAYLTMMCIRLIELHRVLKPTGSIYLHCDPTSSHYLKILMDTIFSPKNFRREIVYNTGSNISGFKSKANNWIRQHDIILYYTKSSNFTFNKQYTPWNEEQLKEFKYTDEKGVYKRYTKYGKEHRQYLSENPGIPIGDIWNDIRTFQYSSQAKKESLGFPTQKPIALLDRIILASSDPDDIVLDPFCGCGTAVISSCKLNRKWIGIDITHLSVSLMKWRLSEAFPHVKIKTIGEPKDLSGAHELAKNNRKQFEYWALSLINGKPSGKKGSDGGIDGYYYFRNAGNIEKGIIQVKSGHIGVSQIRDLRGVMLRENAPIGIFITLNPPTPQMCKEAALLGQYTDPFGNKYPKLSILTIEDILNHNNIKLPPPVQDTNGRILYSGTGVTKELQTYFS